MRYLDAGHTAIRTDDGRTVMCDMGNPDYRRIVAAGSTIEAYAAPTEDLGTYAAENRFELETGGVTVGGDTILTDRASQAMISGAYNYVQANPGTTIQFKTADGFVELTAAQMTAIANAVGAHVQTCFAAEKAIAADIASGAIATTAEIDTDSRWP